eukprot:TRINITY_DN196_c0_g1_i15.p2 TRINITY_DN196_c0_g1~~TRINITY_DN196_c0_g1_i15.p2  ORF type:complete len:110 (+),score=37.47 TRINITY_DN196_c0_g1_i15:29-331(+)
MLGKETLDFGLSKGGTLNELDLGRATAAGPEYIHIHYQQRTAKKCWTIVQGIPEDIDLKRVLKAWKKVFNCNGTILDDPQKGKIIPVSYTHLTLPTNREV